MRALERNDTIASYATAAWNVRLSVGFKDLERTKLFRNHQSIVHFLKYFSRFRSPHMQEGTLRGGRCIRDD